MQFLPDFLLDCFGDVDGKRDVLFILGNIQKRLVQLKWLDNVRIFVEDFVYLAGHRFIDIHPSGNKRELRA